MKRITVGNVQNELQQSQSEISQTTDQAHVAQHMPVRYREPSRAKVLRYSRAVFQGIAASDSELVSTFTTSLQGLLVAYTHSLNNTYSTARATDARIKIKSEDFSNSE